MSNAICHIAFCVDQQNLRQAAVVIHSLVANRSPGPRLHFHIVYDGPVDFSSRLFRFLPWRGHRVHLHHVEQYDLSSVPLHDHVTNAALLRLSLGELLPDIDRVLYLDADLLILADIRPLLATDPAGNAAAAVLDYNLHAAVVHEGRNGTDLHRSYVTDVLGWDVANFRYFNSGVMVLDLEQLRRDGFAASAGRLVRERAELLRWRDQDAINLLLRGRIMPLDPRWNAMIWFLEREERRHCAIESEQAAAALQRSDPWVLHFTTGNKPWRGLVDLPSYELWWRWALRTSPLWYRDYVRQWFRRYRRRIRSRRM